MKFLTRCSLVLVAATVSLNAWAIELETETQQLSYVIGMDMGSMLREQATAGFLEADLDIVVEALRASFKGEETQMTKEEGTAIRQAFIQRLQAERDAEVAAATQANLVEGQTFLAENLAKEGVNVTESGLQYKLLTPSDGAKPAATDIVKVHYRGTFIDGTQFDSSYEREIPFEFSLEGGVIPGWIEGVQLMPVGSKYMFYIPSELGYGAEGGGPIPPSTTLIFEVELLEIIAK